MIRLGRAARFAVAAAIGLTGAVAQEPAPVAAGDGYLGVEVVENAAALEDIGEHVGLKVEAVVENSPAQAAGIRSGDVIVKLAGRSYQWPGQFEAAVAALVPGAPVEVEILRGQVVLRLVVVPLPRLRPPPPPAVRGLAETERVGIQVRTLGREAARAAGLPPNEGVELVDFWGNSPWRRDGLRPGDILHRMDGQPLHDPRELLRRIRRKEPGDPVRLDIVREGRRLAILTVASRRARRTERVFVPVLFNYRSPAPEASSWGVLLDVFQTEWKAGRRTTTLFWVISWTTGEAQSLEELAVFPAPLEP
ncbi:MAG: PDZ domain-containing protein [Planctomycetes bacterium]|nr:PDZ domain-containing protein [Planctomycetota bacterium]